MTAINRIEKCRSCGGGDLTSLFSLGEQYVSDFVTADQQGKGHKVPIELVLCPACKLVQQAYTAPQDFMYTRHYWYRSGVTQTMRDALRNVTEELESFPGLLRPGDVVLDIGSNDGTLLRSYRQRGLIKVGVEPAVNLAEPGSQGVDVFINDFWRAESYFDRIGHYCAVPMRARVVTALGMFYDLEDPNRFIGDIARALDPDGVFIAQLMCLANMMALTDLGNMAHEHLEFYTLESLDYLFGRHGLEIFDLSVNSVNGESYRLFVRHKGAAVQHPDVEHRGTDRLDQARRREQRVASPRFYREFFAEIEEQKRKTVEFIRQQRAAKKTVWVYGASTKGNVILQYYGLDHTLIDAAADRSPEKWGRYTVGTNIPIVSEEEMRRANPNFLLVLPYAFRNEFIAREKEWMDKGGQFIFPLPEFQVV